MGKGLLQASPEGWAQKKVFFLVFSSYMIENQKETPQEKIFFALFSPSPFKLTRNCCIKNSRGNPSFLLVLGGCSRCNGSSSAVALQRTGKGIKFEGRAVVSTILCGQCGYPQQCKNPTARIKMVGKLLLLVGGGRERSGSINY